jgi:hypothetical protein
MARNETMILMMMMISILRGNSPSALQMPPSSSTQLITPNQHGHWKRVVQHSMMYISPCFI